jgi:hypothetical protein
MTGLFSGLSVAGSQEEIGRTERRLQLEAVIRVRIIIKTLIDTLFGQTIVQPFFYYFIHRSLLDGLVWGSTGPKRNRPVMHCITGL